jgi:acyl dehydratase
MSEQYFEEIEVNSIWRSRPFLLQEKDIIEFAKEWNPEPYHTDPEVGRKSPIGSIFAAGVHLISLSVKLANERKPLPKIVAALGWDEVRFINPGLPGDQLVLETETVAKRVSKSQPQFGIIKYAVRLLNQDNQPTLTYFASVMVKTRSADRQPTE